MEDFLALKRKRVQIKFLMAKSGLLSKGSGIDEGNMHASTSQVFGARKEQ